MRVHLLLLSIALTSCTPALDPPTPEPAQNVTAADLLDAAGVHADAVAGSIPTLAGLGAARLPGASADALAASDSGRLALSQLVGCALELDVNLTAGGIDFPGSLGLAPGWLTRPLSGRERELVTACLGAHLSLEGLPVVISLRGSALRASGAERRGFTLLDGRFFGDALGGRPPVIAACRGSGHDGDPQGLELRSCALPDPARPGRTLCGLAFAGDCAAACRGDLCEIGGRRFRALAVFVAQ